MNARTGCLNEYTPMDNYVLENTGNEIVYNELMIENSDYTTPSLSVDQKITAYGYKTLNLCNDNDLRILNGRFGRQNGLATTCTGLSIVDYFMISADLMSEVL